MTVILCEQIHAHNLLKYCERRRKLGLTNNSEIAGKNMSALDTEKLFDEIVDYFTRVEKITINLVNRGLKDKAILNQMVENYLKE